MRRYQPKHYQPLFPVSSLLAIPETCQANNFSVRFDAIPGDQASDSNKRWMSERCRCGRVSECYLDAACEAMQADDSSERLICLVFA
jgi:hypothetical protein